MKAFWDTNIFIYLVEPHAAFHSKVLSLRDDYETRGITVITSALTLGELPVKPVRDGQTELADSYRKLLTSGQMVELVPFDQSVAEYYGLIRATSTLRQPDALQLACAARAGCETFVTNDRRLWGLVIPGLPAIQGL